MARVRLVTRVERSTDAARDIGKIPLETTALVDSHHIPPPDRSRVKSPKYRVAPLVSVKPTSVALEAK